MEDSYVCETDERITDAELGLYVSVFNHGLRDGDLEFLRQFGDEETVEPFFDAHLIGCEGCKEEFRTQYSIDRIVRNGARDMLDRLAESN